MHQFSKIREEKNEIRRLSREQRLWNQKVVPTLLSVPSFLTSAMSSYSIE